MDRRRERFGWRGRVNFARHGPKRRRRCVLFDRWQPAIPVARRRLRAGNEAHSITFNGQRSPADQKWGDYLAVRRC